MVPSLSLVLLPSSVIVAPAAADAGALSLTIGGLFGRSLALAIGALPPNIRLTTTRTASGRETAPRTRTGERNADEFGRSPTMARSPEFGVHARRTVVMPVRITHASVARNQADSRQTSPVSNTGWITRAGLRRIASRGVASTVIDSADGRPDAWRRTNAHCVAVFGGWR